MAWIGPDSNYFPKTVKDEDGKPLDCCILMDHFIYDRLDGLAYLDAGGRKAWLSRQPPKHLSENFRPEPFDQLSTVLKVTGRDGDAKKINIFNGVLELNYRLFMISCTSGFTKIPLVIHCHINREHSISIM